MFIDNVVKNFAVSLWLNEIISIAIEVGIVWAVLNLDCVAQWITTWAAWPHSRRTQPDTHSSFAATSVASSSCSLPLASVLCAPTRRTTTAVASATREHPLKQGRRSDTSLVHLEGDGIQSEDQAIAPANDACMNRLRIAGGLSQIKAARRTLKKYGLLDKSNDDKFPLNGHWETDHGMIVVIEGKMVRWTPARASRLQFTDNCRRSCSLVLYGETTTGELATGIGIVPGAPKMLKWANGDTWHSFDGCRIGQTMLLSQTMTKVQRDVTQDEAARSEMSSKLRLVSRHGLCLLPDCLEQVQKYIGSSTYYVDVHFKTKNDLPGRFEGWAVDFLGSLSKSHPHVELTMTGRREPQCAWKSHTPAEEET